MNFDRGDFDQARLLGLVRRDGVDDPTCLWACRWVWRFLSRSEAYCLCGFSRRDADRSPRSSAFPGFRRHWPEIVLCRGPSSMDANRTCNSSEEGGLPKYTANPSTASHLIRFHLKPRENSLSSASKTRFNSGGSSVPFRSLIRGVSDCGLVKFRGFAESPGYDDSSSSAINSRWHGGRRTGNKTP